MTTEQDFLDAAAQNVTTSADQIFILSYGDSVQRDAVLARADLPVETLAYIAAEIRLTPRGMQMFEKQRNITPALLSKASSRSL